MAWREVEPHVWQRPMGPNEAFIKMIGNVGTPFNKDNWSIAAAVTFDESKLEERALREAWKNLRYIHPSIACTTSADDMLLYRSASSDEIEGWASATFVTVNDLKISQDDVIASRGRTEHATLYYIPHEATVVLHLAHWRTDGFGSLHLLSAFAEALVNPTESTLWGTEQSRLTPPVEVALDLPSETTASIKASAGKYLTSLANVVGALPTPWKGTNTTLPRGTRSARLRLPSCETTAILEACAKRELKMTSAVHAATIRTAYTLVPAEQRQMHHTSTLRHSLRPFLPAPWSGKEGAAGLYTGGYMFKALAEESFLEMAKRLEDEYDSGANSDFIDSRGQYAKTVKGILQGRPPPEVPPSGLDMSSVEDASEIVKGVYSGPTETVKIARVSVGVDVLSRHLYVFFWTFQGRLEMNCVYNEAFYEQSWVDGVVKEVVVQLRDGLDIKERNM